MGAFPLGSPAAIEALATRYEHRAEDLATIGRRVRDGAHSMRWSSNRADRFRSEVDGCQLSTVQMAGELRAIAHDLRRVAAQIQAEYQYLSTLERRVRQAIASYHPKPGSQPPWQGTRWSPNNLPGSGDPAWRDVARALRV